MVTGDRSVCYLSRLLTRQERSYYSTTERECSTVLWSIEILRLYLEAIPFIITDRASLLWLQNLKDSTKILACFKIHRKGKEHVVPDTLSRSVPVIDYITLLKISGIKEWVISNPLKYPHWIVVENKLLLNLRWRGLGHEPNVVAFFPYISLYKH